MFNFTDTRKLSEDGAWVQIKDHGRPLFFPGKDGKDDKTRPVRIKIYGPDSDTLQERFAKRLARAMKDDDGGSDDASKLSEAEIVARLSEAPEQRAEAMVDAVITWENIPGEDGKPVPYSAEAAAELFKKHPDVRRQLEGYLGEDNIERFLDAAAKG